MITFGDGPIAITPDRTTTVSGLLIDNVKTRCREDAVWIEAIPGGYRIQVSVIDPRSFLPALESVKEIKVLNGQFSRTATLERPTLRCREPSPAVTVTAELVNDQW